MFHARGVSLVDGEACGPLLHSKTPLSFWAGTEPLTGEIIDRHHELSGRCLSGHILAIPSGRGSCTGSVAMLELLLAGTAPLGLIFEVPEQIITLGVIVAKRLLQRHVPVVVLSSDEFTALAAYDQVCISGDEVQAGPASWSPPSTASTPNEIDSGTSNQLFLSEYDKGLLIKGAANAKSLAMEILVEFAALQGATSLVDVSQAHIDACVYTGPASLLFAETMLELDDAKVAVPTSMNSISIDQRRWAEIGMEPERAEAANRLGSAYLKMGARPTFTCAPYLLDTAPADRQNIGWGESNAVVFANSVLGARTQKYPDFIDVCIALTGRAPLAGCHVEKNREPQIVLRAPRLDGFDDSLWPLLGYCVGLFSSASIPVVIGIEHLLPTISDLKAFGAAFATTSSAAMFHIRGITPEAWSLDQQYTHLPSTTIQKEDLIRCWQDLNTSRDDSVSLVALGNPHFSLEELHSLATLCDTRTGVTAIPLVVTTSRAICEKFAQSGRQHPFEKVGVQIVSDTCWCMLEKPIVTPGGGNIITNSAKYAHYAPGLVNRKVHFGSLGACVNAAFTGRNPQTVPEWLIENAID